ncbi:MAG: response regulator [Chthoniobacter sp.]|uniref:hybrid sensor histidine kinase/response regulator n=1 Tax=Chthoniobacter sp. TaxID=2510640 RepID=UPI0032A47EA6
MQTPEVSPLQAVGQRNQRILIVDDNAAIHDDVRKILGVPAREDADLDAEAADIFGEEMDSLTAVEFEIDSAFQGQEGLAMVRQALAEGRPYAMAFVDIRMPPGWDGVETISRIWKMYPELQVVICTAYSDYSWAEMIREIGRTDNLVILKKPFDNVEVLQLAHTLTQKWTLNHQLRDHLTTLDQVVARRTEELQTANSRLRQEMEEREQAQKELVESEARFAKAFQASPIPMALQSLTTERFIDVNDAFISVCGLCRMEIVSRTPRELELCPDLDAHDQLFAQLRHGRSVRNFDYPLQSRTSGRRECVISADAFSLGTEMVSLIATVDTTDQRDLEKQLRHSQKLEAVGQFAAGVAHDFNNMLTVIQGHVSLQLAAKGIDKGVASSLEQVSLAAERAASLTRQLLAFSRKQVVQPRVLDLNEIMRSLQEMLSRVIGEHIELCCEFGEKLPAIHADESNIAQIVMNLVVNARDAMPHGGRLGIRTELVEVDLAHGLRHPQAHPGSFIRLSVADTGTGMSAETLGHIFEPFFTTKEVGKGTGLGLATIYGIVAQHDGWIEVLTELGHGSSFQVYLPCHDSTPEPSVSGSVADLRGGDETILVVEDEFAVRKVITDVLKDRGYEVLEASDGPEALAIWSTRGSEVDLLLTDIVMPNGLHGHLLADRLRKEKKELKVILSSGYSSDFGTEAEPLSSRVNFLAKPYKPEVLVKVVRDCLDSN